MNTIFKKSLDKLLSLSADALRGYCCRFRTDLGSAEWKMGLGLLALKRTGAFRELGYSTLSDFAERALSLSGRKVGQLLGAAEALEHLHLALSTSREARTGHAGDGSGVVAFCGCSRYRGSRSQGGAQSSELEAA